MSISATNIRKKPLEQHVSPKFWVGEFAGVSRPGNQKGDAGAKPALQVSVTMEGEMICKRRAGLLLSGTVLASIFVTAPAFAQDAQTDQMQRQINALQSNCRRCKAR